MTEHPFAIPGQTALDEVVAMMADHKLGSAIVIDAYGVAGIFTSVDACRACAEVLRRALA
jgi:CBS domain-containing protein